MRENDPVYEIIRLRLLNDEPLVIEHTYMPVSQVPALSKRILEGSIYSYLHKKLHIKFGGVFHRIKADLPDKYDRQYLGDNESTPILEAVPWGQRKHADSGNRADRLDQFRGQPRIFSVKKPLQQPVLYHGRNQPLNLRKNTH
ncbi:UTRA domain-containing protein [Lactobacillus delbrueckii subsp. bulgaricus]